MKRIEEYLTSDEFTFLPDLVRDLDARIDGVERALETLASDPAQPHYSAAEALKILYRES